MPRRAKLDDSETTVHETARPGSNGFDPVQMKAYIARHEALQAEIDEINQNAHDASLPHREDMAALLKEAAEAGFPKKEFKTVLRKRRLEAKVARVAASLDEDQTQTYEQLLAALGDLAGTPLGEAATDRAAHA